MIPLDARLDIPEGEFSYLLQQWSQPFCVKDSYQSSQADIEQILQLRPSIRALEDINRSISEDVVGGRTSQEIVISSEAEKSQMGQSIRASEASPLRLLRNLRSE